jgi:hypothetical protein
MRLRMSRYCGLMFALSKSKRIDLLSSVITRPMVRRVSGDLPESLLQLCKLRLSLLPIFLSLRRSSAVYCHARSR